MDQIKSNLRLHSRSFIIDGPKKFARSKDFFFEDDYTCASEEKIPDYQLLEMQRRKKHFDEFKKLYNNKLEEKEAKRKAEEEEQHDMFHQHPISKLLSRYGFQVPKSKMSVSSLRSQRNCEFKRSRYRGGRSRSRSGSVSSGRSSVLIDRDRSFEPTISFSDMEIVDIYQRHARGEMETQNRHAVNKTDALSSSTAERREDKATSKLREEIAELEDRFNCILKSFQNTFPHSDRTEFTFNSCDDDSQE